MTSLPMDVWPTRVGQTALCTMQPRFWSLERVAPCMAALDQHGVCCERVASLEKGVTIAKIS